MAKIQVLKKQIAELIAAGEVVERPASAIKELVENAVDAGATSVTVEIQNGGVSFIRVTDNGTGIAREDVPLAFVRHATSKIRSRDDLGAIGTLGFRGEALASICAMARVELLTRTQEELAGTRYVIEGGEEKLCEDAGCPKGTTILVRDLFYNTPARMKFLKKDVAEGNAVAGVLDHAALAHPEIAFCLIRDGREVMRTSGNGDLKAAVFAVYGKAFAAGLIPVEYALGAIRVTGFVSRPADARPTRGMQTFFINNRFVKSRTAAAAVEEACKGSVMAGRFPACVLHIAIPPDAVDVNVHPAKIEVRFVSERPIFDATYHAVKSALANLDRPVRIQVTPKQTPSPTAAAPSAQTTMAAPAKEQKASAFTLPETPLRMQVNLHDAGENGYLIEQPPLRPFRPGSAQPEFFARAPGKKAKSVWQQESLLSPEPSVKEAAQPVRPHLPLQQPAQPITQAAPVPPEKSAGPNEQKQGSFPIEAVPEEANREPALRLVGEAFATYILLETESELIFIDKHAAHERILYEKLKKESGRRYAQQLLSPVAVTLEKEAYSILLERAETLRDAGFELEDFGPGTVLVRSAPLSFAEDDVSGAIIEIAGYLLENRADISTRHDDWIYHNVACRAAIKAGDRNNMQELLALAQQLHENPQLRYCPHGRPIYLAMKKREIERQFGRA